MSVIKINYENVFSKMMTISSLPHCVNNSLPKSIITSIYLLLQCQGAKCKAAFHGYNSWVMQILTHVQYDMIFVEMSTVCKPEITVFWPLRPSFHKNEPSMRWKSYNKDNFMIMGWEGPLVMKLGYLLENKGVNPAKASSDLKTVSICIANLYYLTTRTHFVENSIF